MLQCRSGGHGNISALGLVHKGVNMSRQIPIADYRNQWVGERSRSPWRIWCSNQTRSQRESEGVLTPNRMNNGAICEPLVEDQRLTILLYPDIGLRQGVLADEPGFAAGQEMPWCLVDEPLTYRIAFQLTTLLATTKELSDLDCIDSLCLMVQVYLFYLDWRREERGEGSFFTWLPSIDSPEQARVSLRFPLARLEGIVDFWTTIGARMVPFLRVDRSIEVLTYATIPPVGRFAANNSDNASESAIEKIEEPTRLNYSFSRSGNGWSISYEDEKLWVWGLGADYASMLVSSPFKPIPASQLRADGYSSTKSDFSPADEGLSERPLDVGEPVLDEIAYKQLKDRLQQLNQERGKAKADNARLLSIDEETESIARMLTTSRNQHGKIRSIGDDGELLRQAINAALARFRKKLKDDPNCPKLADHMCAYIKGTGHDFVYNPPQRIAWYIS